MTPSSGSAIVRDLIKVDLKSVTEVMEEDIHAGSSVLNGMVREFDETVVARSLRSAQSAIAAAHQQAEAAGASSEETAIPGPGGIRLFAVAGLGENTPGLGIIDGEDRFLCFSRADEKGTKLTVARWKPEPSAELLAELDELPEQAGDLPAGDLLRAAASLAAYAGPDGRLGLDHVVAEIAKSGGPPSAAFVASMQARPLLGKDGGVALYGRYQAGTDDFAAFAEAIRPLVALIPPAATTDIVVRSSFAAEAAMNADGGFYGATSVMGAEYLREQIMTWRFSQAGEDFAKLGEDVLASGHVWGQQLLVYGNYDRQTFAVQGAEPGVVGRWHRNIDLICDIDSHMVVSTRGDDGAVQRVEIHPCYRPAEAIRHNLESSTAEVIQQLASYRVAFADEEATPPRLTRRMLAERIAQGDPLPPPAGGFDYRTGQLLPGTTDDYQDVIGNAFYGYREDRFAMDKLAAGKAEDIVDDVVTDFTEAGEEEASIDDLPDPRR